MTKYFAAAGFKPDGDSNAVVPVVAVAVAVVDVVFVVVADDAAAAGRATNTPAVSPSELTTSVIAATPAALRLGRGSLTT
jgi:hypothetical protein